MTLKNFTDIDGNTITMSADFGTTGFGTVEPGSRDREEQIVFTGVTNNADGSSTLTGVSNVSFIAPYTQTSGFLKSHPGGVTFVISNTSGYYNTFANKGNDETITGAWLVPDPIANTQIANKEWVLSVVSGGPVSTDTVIVNGTAGENLSSGNLIYVKSSDGKWYKTSGSTASTINDVELGIAQGAATTGNSISGGVLIRGIDTTNSSLTPGSTYYAANTAGTISTSVGTNYRPIGLGDVSGNLIFDPYFTAFANKIAIQNSSYTYAADAQVSDTYVITLSPAPSAYTAGMSVTFKANTANTGAATLNVNSLGPKTIKKNVSADLTTGDILASQISTVIYDGTNFQITPTSDAPLVTTYNLADSPATWTKSANVKTVLVECWAGGASGAAVSATGSNGYGSGGGAGEYVSMLIPADYLPSTVVATIGPGGAAVTKSGGSFTNGNDGTDTTFGSYVTAKKGIKGTGDVTSTPQSGGAGGTGGSTEYFSKDEVGAVGGGSSSSRSGGNGFLAGGGGAGCDKVAAAYNTGTGGTSTYGGAGGDSDAGTGARTGTAGTVPAGGGAAALSANALATSGAGAAGKVKITEYY